MKKSSYLILMLALLTSIQSKAQNVNEKPKLVVELGSGISTILTGKALEKNGD